MKLLRWWGIVAFLVITLLMIGIWYLLAPYLIKGGIEEFGTEALGAKVELNQVELNLFPLGVSLHQLTAADPDAPMQNLVEFNKIQFAIDSETLLWKKVLIDQLVIDGVRLATPRQTSGAIPGGRKSAAAVDKLVELAVPEMEDFDAKTLVNKADLITVKRIEALNQAQQKVQQEWKSALDKDAFDKRIQAIDNEYKRLSERAKSNKLNLIKDAKEWKQLKKDIDAERQQIASLSDKLKHDKGILSENFKQVKNGPGDDLKKIMSELGVDNGVAGLADKYLGPQYTPWITKALAMLEEFKADNTQKAEESAKATVQIGKRVYFKDQHIFPELLIKNIVINGEDQQVKIDGNGTNLGYLPWLVNKPAKLLLNFKGQGEARLDVSSDWKSADVMVTRVDSQISQWPISAMALMDTQAGKWLLDSGKLSAKLSGEITLQKIDLSLIFAIAAPKLSYPENLSAWQSALASSINEQKNIDFKLSAKGELKDPKIKLDSSLENLFQNAIGAELKQQAQKLTGKVQQAITDKVGDISKLENYQDDIDNWQSQLNNKDDLLKDLLGKIKI